MARRAARRAARKGSGAAPAPAAASPAPPPLALWVVFAGVAALVYAPAFGGPFLSDDLYYLQANPYLHAITPSHLLEVLKPRSDLTLMVANYAPVQMLVHMLQWQLFGTWFAGYHLMNVAVHALVAVQLVVWFGRLGVAPLAAAAGGAFFLLHPAQVESVAWISQIKTLAAAALMMTALLVRRSHPAWGTLAFAASLLSKATTAVALPVALLLDLCGFEPRDAARPRRPGRDLLAWSAVFVAFAVVEMVAFRHANPEIPPVSPDPWIRLLSSVALVGRYAWMALSGLGTSTFQEPGPAAGLRDPWVLLGLAVAVGLTARAALQLRRREPEAALWAFAGISFLPVAQVFPFLYPMADRYLYFILPGLVGGALLAGRGLARGLAPAQRRLAVRVLAGALALGLVFFAVRSSERAGIWTSEARLIADAIRHHPQGALAAYERARQAAQRGDARAAADALRVATARGHRDIEHVLSDPALAPVLGTPPVQAVLRDLATRRIEGLERMDRMTEANVINLARALMVRGDLDRAEQVLEAQLARGGVYEATVRDMLRQVRQARRAQAGAR